MTVVEERLGDEASVSQWARSWSRMSPRMRATASFGAVGVFLVLAAWSVVAALTRPAYDRLADLHVYLGAVRAMRDGIQLYSYAAENGDPFTYPPFAALVFWPLRAVPEPFVQVAWTLITVAGVMALAAALTVRHGIAGRQRFLVVMLAAATMLLASAPVQSNLRFGQVSIFVVLLALVDALGLLPRRAGGVLIGVAAAIKLTPLLFVPYLWVVGRRRDAVRSGAAFVACAVVASAVWPAASMTFLAGILLVAGPRRGRIAAGVIVLVTMSVQVGAVLPVGGFLRDNARALCAVAVCCGGAVSLWSATAGRVRLMPGLAVVGRPRTALMYCTAAAAGIAGVLALTHDRAVTAQVYAAGNAQDPVWSGVLGSDPCGGMGLRDGRWICSDLTGPVMGGLQLNFSVSGDPASGIGIEGQVGPDVARLAYVPVQGAKPMAVPLWPELPAPRTAPDMSDTAKMLPVVDQRSMTTHRFAVRTNDATDAVLLAYDRDGHVIGTGGDKLHLR